MSHHNHKVAGLSQIPYENEKKKQKENRTKHMRLVHSSTNSLPQNHGRCFHKAFCKQLLAYLDFGSNLEKILIPNKSLAPINFLNIEKDARSLITKKKKNARSVPKPIPRLLDQ